MNSPLKWLGGKHLLRDTIIECMPIHDCYVETFGGALWVYFRKVPSHVEVVNDVHSELINFYRMVKTHPDCFIAEAGNPLYSREIYEIFNDCDEKHYTEIQRAAMFFYQINIAFGGKWGGVFGIHKSSKPGNSIHDMSAIREVSERFHDTYVEHLSFSKLIPKWDSSDTFFFCDPPYIETAGYKDKFGYKEHTDLAKVLRSIDGKFLVTINDCTMARELYEEFNFKNVKVAYSVSRSDEARKEYDELIITNYEIGESSFIGKNQKSLLNF